ncbi:hypothetical protein V8G54_012564, partial [Vigna mungo]
SQGVTPDPSKVQDIVDWPLPTTLKSLRGFLGLTRFYRRFVKGYAYIASALTDLLKKDNFIWSASATTAFQNLKPAVTTAPVLALPQFDLVFTIQTYASGFGMGAVLSQEDHPIAFSISNFALNCDNHQLTSGNFVLSHLLFRNGDNTCSVATSSSTPTNRQSRNCYLKLS